jgi:hypothetical protein
MSSTEITLEIVIPAYPCSMKKLTCSERRRPKGGCWGDRASVHMDPPLTLKTSPSGVVRPWFDDERHSSGFVLRPSDRPHGLSWVWHHLKWAEWCRKT